jgi:hypothetical protein
MKPGRLLSELNADRMKEIVQYYVDPMSGRKGCFVLQSLPMLSRAKGLLCRWRILLEGKHSSCLDFAAESWVPRRPFLGIAKDALEINGRCRCYEYHAHVLV